MTAESHALTCIHVPAAACQREAHYIGGISTVKPRLRRILVGFSDARSVV